MFANKGLTTPPTMLRTTLLGACLKRGWTDPIHDADLLFVDLDLLHQGPNDLPSRVPVRPLQLLGDAPRELLQLADHQPQLRLVGGLADPLLALGLQLGQPPPRRRDPRLEFRLLEQPVAVSIDQSRNRFFYISLLLEFRSVFTAPTFSTFLFIATGWCLSHRHRYVTELIQASGAVHRGPHSRYHRFFSNAARSIDDLYEALALQAVATFSPAGTIEAAV